jgi:hypothetical protein
MGSMMRSLFQAVDVSEYSEVAQAVEKFSPLSAIIHLAGNPSPETGRE